ncbi:unnamed protein product [Brachionus calyciflorus]|uniref:MULE transposase domain-containing protein n=1 Tax=Brachionus calyciflorus TaxID=104777 RepID=A0A814AZH1_9BILA|nr:unnamed protein product [Brachionus calyciflorus]
MLKQHLINFPKSINCDFELDAINAAISVFGNELNVYGCYFHYSQSLIRRFQKNCFQELFNKEFKYCLKLLQALAFVPVYDIVRGFNLIKNKSPLSFKPILDYFEKTYRNYSHVLIQSLEHFWGLIGMPHHNPIFKFEKLPQPEKSIKISEN